MVAVARQMGGVEGVENTARGGPGVAVPIRTVQLRLYEQLLPLVSFRQLKRIQICVFLREKRQIIIIIEGKVKVEGRSKISH